jgi:uncharacterized protein YndB with AHSA1/START domain
MKKILKITGLVLLALIASILLIAAFVPKNYKVERSVTINKSKENVFEYARYLKNQNEFSVWSKIDPDMKVDYHGTDGTVGFVSAWDSPVKEAGKGEQEIIKIDDGKRIDYEIRFLEPMKSTDNAFLEFTGLNDSTTSVTWGFFGKMKYPMNASLLFLDMDQMLGKDLEGGLNNLKQILERN